MIRKLTALFLLAAFSLALPMGACAAKPKRPDAEATKKPGTASKPDAKPVRVEVPVAEARLFEKAKAKEADGSIGGAIDAYRALVRRYPDSRLAPVAQFKVGQLLQQENDIEAAFRAYSLYVTKYPQGQEFDAVVAGQFKIAKAFLDGARKKVFGVRMFSSMERAQEMFEEIVKNAPYSRVAPQTQFNIGMAQEKQTKYAEAIASYQTTIDKYPNDPVAADALYQIGYVQLGIVERGSNDEGTRIRAREAFEDFTIRYPRSEKIAQARENLQKLTGSNLKKNLQIARFYEHGKEYKAAYIYYTEVINESKTSLEAEEARQGIARLIKKVGGEKELQSGPKRVPGGSAPLYPLGGPGYTGGDIPMPPLPEESELRTSEELFPSLESAPAQNGTALDAPAPTPAAPAKSEP